MEEMEQEITKSTWFSLYANLTGGKLAVKYIIV